VKIVAIKFASQLCQAANFSQRNLNLKKYICFFVMKLKFLALEIKLALHAEKFNFRCALSKMLLNAVLPLAV